MWQTSTMPSPDCLSTAVVWWREYLKSLCTILSKCTCIIKHTAVQFKRLLIFFPSKAWGPSWTAVFQLLPPWVQRHLKTSERLDVWEKWGKCIQYQLCTTQVLCLSTYVERSLHSYTVHHRFFNLQINRTPSHQMTKQTLIFKSTLFLIDVCINDFK